MAVTYLDIIREVRSLGLPCTYGSYEIPPPLPYTVIQYTYDSDVIADNQNYTEVGVYQLELYHDTKHPPSEKLIQNCLKELRLPYRKTEVYIDSEKLYQVIYEIRLIGGN